jgi:hypothetical protein
MTHEISMHILASMIGIGIGCLIAHFVMNYVAKKREDRKE